MEYDFTLSADFLKNHGVAAVLAENKFFENIFPENILRLAFYDAISFPGSTGEDDVGDGNEDSAAGEG